MNSPLQPDSGASAINSRTRLGSGLRGRLLLIEDDLVVQESLRRALESEDYTVHAVGNESAALARIRQGGLQLVVLNVSSDGTEGWRLCEQISELNCLLPVVVITPRGDQHETGLAAGAAVVLEKPLYLPALVEAIECLLHESLDQRLRRVRQGGRGPVSVNS